MTAKCCLMLGLSRQKRITLLNLGNLGNELG